MPPFASSIRSFLIALGYLTRLGTKRIVTEQDLSRSCPFFPFVGLVLGLITCFPFYLGLFSHSPWMQAWLYTCLHIYLTRALHLDGVADIADALGSNTAGSTFHSILKDSRIGAFGAIAICLTISGQVIANGLAFQSQAFALLLFAPVYSRCILLLYAFSTPIHPQASMGRMVGFASKKHCLFSAILMIFLGGLYLLPLNKFIIIILATLPLMMYLRSVAATAGGYSGDFLGACLVYTELVCTLCYFII